MKFGDLLRQLREKKDMTRKDLTSASGLKFGTIHNYEISRRAPSFANVIALAKALGVDCTTFAGCDDVTGIPEPAEKPTKKKGKK